MNHCQGALRDSNRSNQGSCAARVKLQDPSFILFSAILKSHVTHQHRQYLATAGSRHHQPDTTFISALPRDGNLEGSVESGGGGDGKRDEFKTVEVVSCNSYGEGCGDGHGELDCFAGSVGTQRASV